MRGKSDAKKAVTLLANLHGDAFSLYYKTFADGDSLNAKVGDYPQIKRRISQ